MDDDFEMNEEELMRMESEMLAEQAAAKLKKKLDAAKLKKKLEDASKMLKEHKKKVEEVQKAMMSRSVKINLVVEAMCTFLENGIAAIDDERPEVDTDWIIKRWDSFEERLSEIALEGRFLKPGFLRRAMPRGMILMRIEENMITHSMRCDHERIEENIMAESAATKK